ncbi:MAG TPA: hypothetical protein VFQ06_15550 [Nitrospira sp.]|nr:hypothetical protein [Nitrospira sp.]
MSDDKKIKDYFEEFVAAGGVVPPMPQTPELVLVTPALAVKWLDANTENRKLREARAEAFSRDMLSGEWDPEVGDPVHFNEANGVLGNGQHRLRAVELSQTAQWFYVFYVNSRTLTKIDRGTKRSFVDNAVFAGKIVSPLQAGIARRLITTEAGYSPVATGRYTPSDGEMAAIIETNGEEIVRAAKVALAIRQSNVQVRAGVTGIAYLLCARIDSDFADHFFMTQLADKTGLEYSDPANALMRRLANYKTTVGGKMPDPELWNYIILAWNHARGGRKIDRLIAPRNEWGPNGYAVPI